MSSSSSSPVEFSLDNPPSDGVTSVQFAPGSSSAPAASDHLLLASSWDRSVRVYDTQHNNLKCQYDFPASILECCFGMDHSSGFAGGLDGDIHQLDLTSGSQSILGSHTTTNPPASGNSTSAGAVRCLCFHGGTGLLFSGGWDGAMCAWDVRQSPGKQTHRTVPVEGQKIYTMSLSGNRLIIGTSARHVVIYDVRRLSQPEQRRESSLLNQTRIIRGFPDESGYALGSIEGRVAIEYFNPDPAVQKNKYAFKCHRKMEGKTSVLYPVNAMAFHPKYGTFATGGCDGVVNVWDGANKKRICQYPPYQTSIAALAFNASGDKLAVAASYTWEEGEKDHPADAIYIRTVHPNDVLPKQRVPKPAA